MLRERAGGGDVFSVEKTSDVFNVQKLVRRWQALDEEQENKMGGKMYIQDKVEEYTGKIFANLEGGAHMYFCELVEEPAVDAVGELDVEELHVEELDVDHGLDERLLKRLLERPFEPWSLQVGRTPVERIYKLAEVPPPGGALVRPRAPLPPDPGPGRLSSVNGAPSRMSCFVASFSLTGAAFPEVPISLAWAPGEFF